MATYDKFKKTDKSEKVTVVHIEPVRQLIRWTDQGCERFTKEIATPYKKTNSIPISVKRNDVELIDYNLFEFLEKDDDNPFLTDDNQFYLMEF